MISEMIKTFFVDATDLLAHWTSSQLGERAPCNSRLRLSSHAVGFDDELMSK